jgi:hypothetical protein
MLTSTSANLLTNKLNQAFDKIGRSNGTSMPHSERNTENVAWELHVARHLSSLADGRKKAATKAAIQSGVIFDYENNPKPAGTTESVYNGDVVSVNVLVKKGRAILNSDSFINDLLNAGVDRALVGKLVDKHTKLSAPAHNFTTALVTG